MCCISRTACGPRNAQETFTDTYPIPQFCRWFEPLIDMQNVIGKLWNPGSASAAMLCAIQSHQDFKEADHTLVVIHVRFAH